MAQGDNGSTARRLPSYRRLATGAAVGVATGVLFSRMGLQYALTYDGDRFVGALVVAVAIALLWLTRLRVVFAASLALLVGLWLVIASTPLSLILCRGLVRSDVLAPADAIFVLASSIQPDGDMNSSSFARTHHAISLARAGLAPRLVVAETRSGPSHAGAVRRALERLGLDVPVEVVPGRATNTHDEAVGAARLFHERGWRRVILVTSPLHSRRAAAVFEHEGLEVICSPSDETRFNVQKLLGADDRLDAFGEMVHERLGYWVYHRRGWL